MGEDTNIVERHNLLVAEIATRIITESGATNENMTPVLVILESVIGGVITTIARPGHENDLFDVLVKGVRERMKDIILYNARPEGSG